MEEYTEILKGYLRGKRNVKKKIYKFMNTAYRAVKNNRATWEKIIKILGR